MNYRLFSLCFQSPCESDPCKNGAVCVPEYEFNSYRCHCKLGFCGKNCEHGGISFLIFLNVSTATHIRKEQVPVVFLLFKNFGGCVCM